MKKISWVCDICSHEEPRGDEDLPMGWLSLKELGLTVHVCSRCRPEVRQSVYKTVAGMKNAHES